MASCRFHKRRPWRCVAVFAVADPLGDGEDEDREELRDLAAVTLQGNSMQSIVWPPRVVHYDDADQKRLKLDRLEGRRGGKAGAQDVPPFHRWPYYEVAISEVPLLSGNEPEVQEHYRVLDLSEKQEMAFKMAHRWKQINTGRSLYFTETGAAKLSSTVATVPILLRQVQGLFVLSQWIAERQAGEEVDFDEFIREKEADEATANELREVLGLPLAGSAVNASQNGHARQHAAELLQAVHLDAVIGREKGSALAVWVLDSESSTARVEFCVGHDCMNFGPRAEEALLRIVSAKAAKQGADRLRCRVRFTEDGCVFVSGSLRQLGMTPVCPEDWRDEFVEEAEEEEVGVKEAELIAEGASVLAEDVPESVPGLRTWLTVQGIQVHLPVVNAWCEEMGAATLDEVIDNREDLAEALGDQLSSAERQCLREREY